MEDHSEGRFVNQFCPRNNVILKFREGEESPDIRFFKFFYYVKNWKVLAYHTS